MSEGRSGSQEAFTDDAPGVRGRYAGEGTSGFAPGGGQAKSKGRGIDAGALVSGSGSLGQRRRRAVGSGNLAEEGEYGDGKEDTLQAADARLLPEGAPEDVVTSPQELGKQGTTAKEGKGRPGTPIAVVRAPSMPSSSTTLAAVVLLAFSLLVLPAVLPSVPSPPAELLLLPVIVMGLLLFVAHSRDTLPPTPSGTSS